MSYSTEQILAAHKKAKPPFFPGNVNDFTIDELKILVTTLDGIGRDNKMIVLSSLLAKVNNEKNKIT